MNCTIRPVLLLTYQEVFLAKRGIMTAMPNECPERVLSLEIGFRAEELGKYDINRINQAANIN